MWSIYCYPHLTSGETEAGKSQAENALSCLGMFYLWVPNLEIAQMHGAPWAHTHLIQSSGSSGDWISEALGPAAACLTLGSFLKIQSQEHGHAAPPWQPLQSCTGVIVPLTRICTLAGLWKACEINWARQVKFAACKLWLELKICCEVVCPRCQGE